MGREEGTLLVLDVALIPPENAFSIQNVEPRLAEFDMGGVLYHARYFHVYEDAREQFLKSIGIAYPMLVDQGIHLAVIEAHQNFQAPVRYGVPFQVTLWVEDLKRSHFTFHYAFLSEEFKVFHRAWTKHAVVQKSEIGLRTTRVPQELNVQLEKFLSPKPI